MTNKLRNFSVYRGHSDQGGGGEQYLHTEDELTDTKLLDNIIPWLSLDAKEKDYSRLNDQLEGWSYFSEGDYYFIVRLTSAGRYGSGNRISYFSHARAFFKNNISKKQDPGLYLGLSEAFEKPWRTQNQQVSINLPEIGLSTHFLTELESEKETLIKYISHFYESLINQVPLVILAPITDFKSSSALHKLISLSRACLPQSLRNECHIRIYTREVLDYFSKADLVAIPDDLENSAKIVFPKATFLDRHGNIIKSSVQESPYHSRYTDYAEAIVTRLYDGHETHKASQQDSNFLPEFSAKIAVLFKQLNKDKSLTPVAEAEILVNFSCFINQLPLLNDEYKNAFFNDYIKNILLGQYPAAEWDILLEDNDLSCFSAKTLIEFSLEDISQPDNLKRLQNRVVTYLSENKAIINDFEQDSQFPGLTTTANRIETLLKTSPAFFSSALLDVLFTNVNQTIDSTYPYLLTQKLLLTAQKDNFDSISIALFLQELEAADKKSGTYQQVIKELAVKITIPDFEQQFQEICASDFLETKIDIFEKLYELTGDDRENYYAIIEQLIQSFINKNDKIKVSDYCQSCLLDFINYKESQLSLKNIFDILSLCHFNEEKLKSIWCKLPNLDQYAQPVPDNHFIFDTRYKRLYPEYIFIDHNKLIDLWIKILPGKLIKNRELLKAINIQQKVEILAKSKNILTVDDEADLVFLISYIDQYIKECVKKSGLSIIDKLVEEDIFDGWSKYSQLIDEKKAIAFYLLLDLKKKEIRYETWCYIVENLKNHTITWVDISTKPENCIPWIDAFANEQYNDLLRLKPGNEVKDWINGQWNIKFPDTLKNYENLFSLTNTAQTKRQDNQRTKKWTAFDWVDENSKLYQLKNELVGALENNNSDYFTNTKINRFSRGESIRNIFYSERIIAPNDFIVSINKVVVSGLKEKIINHNSDYFDQESLIYIKLLFAIDKKNDIGDLMQALYKKLNKRPTIKDNASFLNAISNRIEHYSKPGDKRFKKYWEQKYGSSNNVSKKNKQSW